METAFWTAKQKTDKALGAAAATARRVADAAAVRETLQYFEVYEAGGKVTVNYGHMSAPNLFCRFSVKPEVSDGHLHKIYIAARTIENPVGFIEFCPKEVQQFQELVRLAYA